MRISKQYLLLYRNVNSITVRGLVDQIQNSLNRLKFNLNNYYLKDISSEIYYRMKLSNKIGYAKDNCCGKGHKWDIQALMTCIPAKQGCARSWWNDRSFPRTNRMIKSDPIVPKKNERLERVLENIGTIGKRTERELLEKNSKNR